MLPAMGFKPRLSSPPASTEAMPPQVSVIIPAYNGERFIAEAIDSVLHQTCTDWELIAIDDGSTDRTRQVLAAYGDRIQVIAQTNQGVATARNRGWQTAQGEWIAFFDQDDVWRSDKLALQLQTANNHPQAGIVHSGWRLVDAQRRPLSEVKPWQNFPKLDLVGWVTGMPVLLSAMLIRRSWIDRVGGLQTHYRQACDVDLVQRLALAGCETVWLPQVVVDYRQHDQNDSNNTLVQATESWAVRREFFDRPDLPPEIRSIESACCYYTLVWIAWRLFYTGRFTEMAHYLELSLRYTPLLRTETLQHWITSFTQYSAERKTALAIDRLIQSPAWQQAVARCLS